MRGERHDGEELEHLGGCELLVRVRVRVRVRVGVRVRVRVSLCPCSHAAWPATNRGDRCHTDPLAVASRSSCHTGARAQPRLGAELRVGTGHGIGIKVVQMSAACAMAEPTRVVRCAVACACSLCDNNVNDADTDVIGPVYNT